MTTKREQIKAKLKEGVKELKKIQQGSRNPRILKIIKDAIEQEDRANTENVVEKGEIRDKAAMPKEEHSQTI